MTRLLLPAAKHAIQPEAHWRCVCAAVACLESKRCRAAIPHVCVPAGVFDTDGLTALRRRPIPHIRDLLVASERPRQLPGAQCHTGVIRKADIGDEARPPVITHDIADRALSAGRRRRSGRWRWRW